ncbi:MAG: non-ribosomal peptide synthetase [Sphingomonas sp.]
MVPITREQRHIWLDLIRMNDGLAYHEPMVARFEGPSNPEIIARSLEVVIQRHEALRTSFRDLDGEPVQIIHDKLDVLLPTVDLSGLATNEQEAAVRTIAAEDAAIPFDLAQPPLLRARIIRLSDTDHRLALTLHHILFDGRSLIAALLPELATIHAGLVAGRAAPLPPPVAQYGDYAIWQRVAGDRNWDRELDFWRETLAGEPCRLILPVDRPRGSTAERMAATESIDIPAGQFHAFEAIARSHASSTYAALVATLMTLLRRYGNDDIVVGSVVDTRSSARLGAMLGYCLNTVALRSRPRPDMPFGEFLDQVRDLLFGAYEHASVPFERVVQTLGGAVPGMEDGRFQVMISLQPALPHPAPAVRLTTLTPPRTKADLHLELEERADGLQARFTYDRSLFDAETIRSMAAHWASLLASIVADPSAPLGDLAMLPADETARLAALGRGPRQPIPEATLHGLVDRTIERQPDTVAVTCGETSLTYAALGARADAIAQALLRVGATEGALVALCVERSVSAVAAILGILKIGAAYVPLDPGCPSARLATVLDDAAPRLLLCDASTRPLFAATAVSTLALEEIADEPSGVAPASAGSPDDLACVIYTSGSTGVPKGVEIEHRSIVNVIESMCRRLGFRQGDTMLALSRLTFDMSVADIFLPLTAGGTIAMAPSGSVVDPALLAAMIDESHCSLLEATPTTWQSLVSNGWAGRPGMKAISGGEPLARALADALLERGLRLWNGYGPTEASIYTTMDEVQRQGAIGIGRPIDNVDVSIVDDRGRDVPCNIPGHLYIGGAGLARRYRDAALTARAFTERDGRRSYCSGDLAVRRRDGRLEWLGRSDGQIKIRGFRIDVGDVEAAICTCPGIALAAVTVIDGATGQGDLAAYVTAQPGRAAPDFTALRSWLSERLPAYMIPTRYMVLAALPVSGTGKIQHNALPPIDPGTVTWAEPEAAELPRGDVEERIAAIWREVLGIKAVGATDDFFDLGGHSLLAAKLIGRLSSEFGQRLPFATMMRAPTVRQMAAILTGHGAPATTPRTLVIGEAIGRPLFWIDATPNFRVNYFRDLAAALGDDIALIGLPVDTERFARTEGDDCIDAIVGEMTAAVIESGHKGPYLLGGWCNGGTLALAVANRLRARGETVDAVVMLDSTNQAYYRRKVQRLRLEVAQFINSPADERPTYVREMLAGYVSRLRRRVVPARNEATALLNTSDRYARIIRAMPPPHYDGRVIDVRPAGGVGARSARLEDMLTGPVDAVKIPGGHQSVLHPPYVIELAQRVRALVSGPPVEDARRVMVEAG